MRTNGGNDKCDCEGHERIKELKRQVDELAGGEAFTWKSNDLTPHMEEDFLRSVIDYENAPWTTHFQQLEDANIEMPEPASVDDEKLTAKLWEVIEALARMRVFLLNTNHLSDRELYKRLWSEVLREATKAIAFDEYSAWHIDLIGSGSDDDIELWMKYYADEKTRNGWMAEWPDYQMPEHEEPPYDRDRHLPGSGF